MDFFARHESGASHNDTALESVVEIDAMASLPMGISSRRANRVSTVSSSASLAAVQLPPIETAAFVSGRHEVNPAIALNLIQDIQKAIFQWQAQQRQIVAAMRAIYAQGPMVDGWLQSSLPSSPVQTSSGHLAEHSTDATILRHGDADALMRYVESLGSYGAAGSNSMAEYEVQDRLETGGAPSSVHSSAGPTQYWLCCLSDDGSVKAQFCPPEQMATVGNAIARFQKFKQLKLQQQALEAKLQQAVDMLTGVRNNVRESFDG